MAIVLLKLQFVFWSMEQKYKTSLISNAFDIKMLQSRQFSSNFRAVSVINLIDYVFLSVHTLGAWPKYKIQKAE
jgi:hypothetical protein